MTPEATEAEKRAAQATELESFPINLLEIRRTLSMLLSEVGRYGFFNQYTTHNFEHVHEMLQTLEWLVPAESQSSMTKADWLMIVLACYFHDLGLLITNDEFAKRHQSAFPQFCADVLFSGSDGADYRAKVNELDEADRDKFLYQEFVRYNHAARVGLWIEEKPTLALGAAQAVAERSSGYSAPLMTASAATSQIYPKAII
jgi:molecular chaperone HtpG